MTTKEKEFCPFSGDSAKKLCEFSSNTKPKPNNYHGNQSFSSSRHSHHRIVLL
jgi:hypothetical protein